jgi:Tol biopolymer transport system component
MGVISLNINELLKNFAFNDNLIIKNINQISTGQKVTSAKDDPSGMEVANKARARVESLTQADKNIQDAMTMLEIKDQTIQAVMDLTLKIRDIAVKVKSDDSLSAAQKADAKQRIDKYLFEIVDTQTKMEYNHSVEMNKETIYFQTSRNGNWDIYSMDTDGTNVQAVINTPQTDVAPSWAPDGSKFAYMSSGAGDAEVYIYDVATGTSTNITNNPSSDGIGIVAWSPDSTKIAFTSDRNGPLNIFLANADGTGLVNLTGGGSNNTSPMWSPDGTKIAFTSDRTGTNQVFTVNSDGTGLTNVSSSAFDDTLPAWAPDSSKLAFVSTRSGASDIYAVNADGSGLTQITNTPTQEYYPAWSYGGDKIYYSTLVAGNWQLFSANSDGSGATQLTNSALHNYLPSWSAKYDKLLFLSARTGDWDVFTMNTDGTSQTNLTNNPAFDTVTNETFAWHTILKVMTIQTGPNNGDTLDFLLRPTMPKNIGIDDLNVSNQNFAAISVNRCDSAIVKLTNYRTEVRTMVGELKNLAAITEDEKKGDGEFISRITNTDDALAQAERVKLSITQYFAISALAQANVIRDKTTEFLLGSVNK